MLKRKHKISLDERLYHLLRFAGFLLSLPSPAALGRVARVLAFIGFDVLRIRRRLVLSNLRTALGDERSARDLAAIGRESVYQFVLGTLEFLRGYHGDIASHVEIHGREYLDEALLRGQGAFALSLHMGNWEAMGAAMSRLIRPTRVIVKKVGSDSVNRFVEETRHRNGFLVISRRSRGDAVRGIRKTLAAGEVVGFVFDQSRPGEPKLPFFGKPAKTNTGLATISRRTTAPILPCFTVRTAPCRHEIHILPEVKPVQTGDREKDILEGSAFFNRVLEDIIRSHPDQYFWLHNRWKE